MEPKDSNIIEIVNLESRMIMSYFYDKLEGLYHRASKSELDNIVENFKEQLTKKLSKVFSKSYIFDNDVVKNANFKDKIIEVFSNETSYENNLRKFVENKGKSIARSGLSVDGINITVEDRYNALLELKQHGINLLSRLRICNYQDLVKFITDNVRNPKEVVEKINFVLGRADSGLSDREKEYLREYLEVFNLTSDYDPEAEMKAKEELGNDPFISAHCNRLIRVAKILEDQGKYRLADRATELLSHI